MQDSSSLRQMKEMFYCGIYYTVTQKQKLLFEKTRLLYVQPLAIFLVNSSTIILLQR